MESVISKGGSRQSCQSSESIHQIHSSIPPSKNQYFQSIPTISEKYLSQKQQLLKKNGFIHTKGIYHKFQATIIQAKNQMIIYEVAFGQYKTQLSVFCSNIELSSQRNFIGAGNLGKVLEIEFKGDKIAAKCISKSQSILYPTDKCLKQVFMLKFASVLGVGPHYHSNYCYDILVLKNHSEFLMQYCQQPLILKDKGKRKQQNILHALALLHSFKAVHMDIKPQNIAYSPHFQKFVLIDFGFSEFIKENIGQKTFIMPKGTYQFMNQEMQDASRLNRKSLIDLYDNDMFGLHKTVRMFTGEKSRITKQYIPQQSCSFLAYQWSEYTNYFKASYYLATSNLAEFEKLVLHDKKHNLPFSLRRLVRQGDISEKTKTKYVKYLNEICSEKYLTKSYDQILDLKCADAQLYKQVNIAQSQSLERYEKDIKNIEVLFYKKEEFSNLWRIRGWIDQIFTLLFLKKQMPPNQRDLKENIFNFLNKQRSENRNQKQLNVLKTFKEEYQVKMDYQHLLQIKYIYESSGFFHQAKMLCSIIWQLVEILDNQLFCVLNLKLYVCEFIINQLQWLQWYPMIVQKQIVKESTPFEISIKIIDELKNISQNNQYCKPTKSTFDSLWSLYFKLKDTIKEEKARMIILKLENLFLHLQYNLLDICYMATNQHQHKYDIKEQVKPDLYDPVFNIKRQFIALQKQNYRYLLQTVSLKEINRQIKKYQKQQIPFLSRIKNIWQFGKQVEEGKFQKAAMILESVFLPSLDHIKNLSLFVQFFERHLFQAIKNSNQCFSLFLRCFHKIIDQLQRVTTKLKDKLILVNKLLLLIPMFWDYLYYLNDQQKKLEQLTQLYFLISSKVKQHFQTQITASQEAKVKYFYNKQEIPKLSQYIETMGDIMLNTITGQSSVRDTKVLQLLKDISLLQSMIPCIDGCFYLLQICSKFFSADLDLISQKYIVQIFNSRQSLQFAITYMNYQFVYESIFRSFFLNKRYAEFQLFEVRLSFQLKHTRYLQIRYIPYKYCIYTYGENIPTNCITQFCNSTLSVHRLEEIYNNSIFVFITYKCLKLVREKLLIEIQKRLIVLVSHGMTLFMGNHPKRQIKGYILKVQLLLNQQWNSRKKLINVKTEKICEEKSLFSYKKQCIIRIQKKKLNNNKTWENILKTYKAKLKKIKMSDN